MSELKPYEVDQEGTKTTLMLTDEEAKARGLKSAPSTEKSTEKPAEKPAEKASEPAANKARLSTPNK